MRTEMWHTVLPTGTVQTAEVDVQKRGDIEVVEVEYGTFRDLMGLAGYKYDGGVRR